MLTGNLRETRKKIYGFFLWLLLECLFYLQCSHFSAPSRSGVPQLHYFRAPTRFLPLLPLIFFYSFLAPPFGLDLSVLRIFLSAPFCPSPFPPLFPSISWDHLFLPPLPPTPPSFASSWPHPPPSLPRPRLFLAFLVSAR